MSQGGAAIRDQSAAINGNLVLTQQQIAEDQQLQIAEYNLSEEGKGLSVTLGSDLIPAFTVLVGQVERDAEGISTLADDLFKAQSVGTLLGDWMTAFKEVIGQHQTSVDDSSQAWITFWASIAGGGSEGAAGNVDHNGGERTHYQDGSVGIPEGITQNESSRWQLEASLDDAFQRLMNLIHSDITDLTSKILTTFQRA